MGLIACFVAGGPSNSLQWHRVAGVDPFWSGAALPQDLETLLRHVDPPERDELAHAWQAADAAATAVLDIPDCPAVLTMMRLGDVRLGWITRRGEGEQAARRFAHDVSQPLAAVTNLLAAIEMLRKLPDTEERIGRAIADARVQIDRAGAMVRAMRQSLDQSGD